MKIKPGTVIIRKSLFSESTARYLYCGSVFIKHRKYRLLYRMTTGNRGYMPVCEDWMKYRSTRIDMRGAYPELAAKRKRRFLEKYSEEEKEQLIRT